jgi:very-short-patch-repair endonuclease
MPIRQLFKKIPNLLPRLKPCLLMSPLSVAQYLDPAHPPFDLVVFDEASQIPVWDAVGAIARGKEAVIVGDPKQLPPTSFFARADDSEELEEDVVEDMESILDDCLAARFPKMYLRWHYRSRHESLIAFSNYHYYDNKLLTFPSPSRELGVSLRHIDGAYDKSKSRTNRAEAEAIVAEVLRRFRDPNLSRYSIGIVTFSMSQQTLIDDLLDEARRIYPEIEIFFDGKTAPNNEALFVKNLENVQGDERDAVLFSICYGPDAQGRVSMNFGPINRDGGERRLNVAITRARREVIVFSTLRPEQIDLSRVRARGMADLKSFLDYAARGTVALAEECSTDPSAECESFFEVQVCEALRNRGYSVHTQVGCSHYRIDLAVVDPENPGRYLLGIECDGANYHRAKTARDRDRLRENVLKDLGWRLHRVWSTDWWERPEDELARIEAAIAEARETSTQDREQTQIASAPVLSAVKLEPILEKPVQHNQAVNNNPNSQPYEPVPVSRIFGDLLAFYQPSASDLIKRVLEDVINQEGPIAMTLAAKRVAAHWGIGKVGSKVSQRIAQLVSSAGIKWSESDGRFFLWRRGVSPSGYKLFRVPGKDEASKRNADELPPEEIANAALHILRNQISIPIEDLICETARLFGFARTGQKVATSMKFGIDLLLNRGDAEQQDGVIVFKG